MKKSYKMVLLLILIIVIGVVVYFVFFNKKDNSDKIPEGYMVVFYGKSGGEVQNLTYIYKIDNKDSKYGFKYINATSEKIKGSSKNKIKITEKGTVNWIEDVSRVVKENDAFMYAQEEKSGTIYTAEEYISMILILEL